MMKAVILAGGQDMGKCPLSLVRPRPLFPVLNSVLLQNLLDELRLADVGEAIICANGKTHILREHFDDNPAACVELDFHEDKLPRGAAGCLRDVACSLKDGAFLVVEGSLFLDGGVAELVEEHRRNGAAVTVGAAPSANWQSGNGTEEDDGRMSPVGVYVVEPAVLDHIPARGYFDIKEQLIPVLLKNRLGVAASRFCGKHRRVVNASSYAVLVQEMLSGAFGGGHFDGLHEAAPQVWVAGDADVHPSATIIGPAVIGSRARVGKDTTILGPSLVSEGVVLGDQTVVSGSILWNDATVGSGARVERSIVTDSFCVKDFSRLSACVAIDRDLNIGDMHGLRLGGYDIGSAQRTRPSATDDMKWSLSGLLRSFTFSFTW